MSEQIAVRGDPRVLGAMSAIGDGLGIQTLLDVTVPENYGARLP